jgi:type IV pilus assembly protein PilY1
VLNTNLDSLGFVDRIYVGDVAANVFRFDVDNSDVAAWTGKKLAVLSDASPPNRKIFFPPVVVKQSLTNSSGVKQDFDSVYVGTGDREHPLKQEVVAGVPVSDKIFMIKDLDIGLTSDPAYIATFPNDFLTLKSTSSAGVTVDDLQSAKGWSRDLDPGEKVTGSPSVFGNRLRFSSYVPQASNVCTTGGESRLTELNATTGDFTLTIGATPVRFQPGTSSTYMSGTVEILIGGKVHVVTFGIGEGQKGGFLPPGPITPTPGLGRVYWYMEPEL